MRCLQCGRDDEHTHCMVVIEDCDLRRMKRENTRLRRDREILLQVVEDKTVKGVGAMADMDDKDKEKTVKSEEVYIDPKPTPKEPFLPKYNNDPILERQLWMANLMGSVLFFAITQALNELGVPQAGYPMPVVNAIEILSSSLKVVGLSKDRHGR
jgi:hypothetical protein